MDQIIIYLIFPSSKWWFYPINSKPMAWFPTEPLGTIKEARFEINPQRGIAHTHTQWSYCAQRVFLKIKCKLASDHHSVSLLLSEQGQKLGTQWSQPIHSEPSSSYKAISYWVGQTQTPLPSGSRNKELGPQITGGLGRCVRSWGSDVWYQA